MNEQHDPSRLPGRGRKKTRDESLARSRITWFPAIGQSRVAQGAPYLAPVPRVFPSLEGASCQSHIKSARHRGNACPPFTQPEMEREKDAPVSVSGCRFRGNWLNVWRWDWMTPQANYTGWSRKKVHSFFNRAERIEYNF